MASSTFFTSSTPLEHPAEQIELKSYLKNLTESQVLEFFEVADCVKWIRELSAQRVALQFPDGFLIFARRIAVALEAETLAKTFVLADTSYRSCCIDEVAAAHATCDALIHFGEACLSAPTRNIPVRYVLGKMPIDLQHLKSTIDAQNLAPNSTVILTDSIYSHLETQITEIFGANSKMAQISNDASSSYLGRATWDFQEENLIFIGANDTPLLPLWILSYPNFTQVYHYDPAEKSMTQDSTRSCRQLRRRLFLVEKLKDANTVGLVVGSVGVDQHKEAVQRMRQLCKAAGKKIYVISVGKINVPKLSNFSSDIDVFVLLSCPFGVLLDSGDYYRPVLSFFEAEIALNPSKSHWAADSGWRADFGRHLQDQIATHSNPEVQEGDVSLISGKVRARPEIIQNGEGPEAQKTTVALYSAGDYFAERSWKGLDDTAATVTQSTVVEEGRRGIAQGYQGK